MTTIAASLDQAISAVCPINGVSIGEEADRSTWKINFTDDSTEEQKAAAETVLASFVHVDRPSQVSARQFKLQLLSAGLLDDVDDWIASQSKAVQIAYQYSGTFVRTEPMMAAGFAAMGFTDEQIDEFFMAAAAL